MLKRIIALTMTLIMALSVLAGCSSMTAGRIDPIKNNIAEVSGEIIPSDTYQYYLSNNLINYAANILQYYGQNANMTDTLKQILSQAGEDGSTIADSIKKSLMEQVKYEYAVNALCESYNLKLDATDEKTISDNIEASIKQYGSEENFSDLLDVFMIDIDGYKNIMANSIRYQKLVLHLFGENGIEAKIPAQEVKDHYAKNNSLVKHILIDTQASTMKLATGETTDEYIAKKKALAEDIYKKVTNGEDYDALLKKYGEDPGMTSSPKGYVVNASSNYVKEFQEAALNMKVGEYRLVKSDYGYHVMYRDDVFKAGEFDDLTERINYKSKEIDEIIANKLKNVDFKYNDKTLSKLDPLNIDMSKIINKYMEVSERLEKVNTTKESK
ncbi:MAG: peptidylprolyl isomerase [Clostridia bacterium]|nr:peptidylprolyl isomerase [Clostridia bacterium]